jgi:transposase
VSSKQARTAAEVKIRERFRKLRNDLTERARRLFAATEAIAFGHGGVTAVAHATGMSRVSIAKGIQELRALEDGTATPMDPTRSRRPGGGRKKTTTKDPRLLPDLKALVESTTRGDPMSPLLWTARSQRNLVAALKNQGHQTSMKMVARLLKELGYSLQANRKRLEGAQHPDRNAQFEHINETLRRQLETGQPAISVDTKKRELLGPYKNGGREVSPKADPVDVNVHDFVNEEKGRATPYGVYDLHKNEAWVSVGISHDTAEFAVQSIRTW